MLNKLFPGHLNTPAASYLVHLSGLSLMAAVFTAKVIQFTVVSGILAIVLIDENSARP
jgi:hypothetical protein